MMNFLWCVLRGGGQCTRAMRRSAQWSLLCVVAVACGLMGCSAATGSTSSDNVNITGTVLAPTGITGTVQSPISSNVSKHARPARAARTLKSVSVSHDAAASLRCTLYTLTGTALGSATADASGAVAFTVAQSDLGSEARLALRCVDAAGLIDVESALVTPVESTTTTIDLGTADETSTQAAIGLRNYLDCDWASSTCTLPSGIDFRCALSAERAVVRGASLDATNASLRIALVNIVGSILMSENFDPASAGFSDMAALLAALHRADGLSADARAVIAPIVASALQSDTTTIDALLASADDHAAALDQVIGGTLASTVGQRAGSDGQSFCDRAATDDHLTDLAVDPLLTASSSTALRTTYEQAGAWGVIIDTLDTVSAQSDATTLDDRIDLLGAYLESFNGNFSTVYNTDTGAVDTLTPDGLIAILRDVDPTATESDQRDFVEGWQQLVETLDGWSTLFPDGSTLDSELADYIDAHFADAEFDPTTFDYTNFEYNLDGIDLTAADACEALDDYDAKIACYEALYGTFAADDDTVVFRITEVSPTDGSTVSTADPFRVTATFNDAVDSATLSQTTFQVYALDAAGEMQHAVTGSVTYDDTSQTIIFTPAIAEDFISGNSYRAVIDASLQDTSANSLGDNYQWDFIAQ